MWFSFLIWSILDVSLPSFEDVDCPEAPQDAPEADLCIHVHIADVLSEMIVLTRATDTIYEGYLGDINDHVFVVMIDEPEDKSRLVRTFTTHFVIKIEVH